VTFRLDGWDLDRVIQCRLKINNTLIDTDVPTDINLQFISGKKIHMFAILRLPVHVEVVSEIDATGNLCVLSEPYPGRYDAKSGVIYRDEFTDIDNTPRILTYQIGRVTIR